MPIERVIIEKNLRGAKILYPKGTVYDIKDGPIPSELLVELKNRSGTVRVLDPEVPSPELNPVDIDPDIKAIRSMKSKDAVSGYLKKAFDIDVEEGTSFNDMKELALEKRMERISSLI